jgi:hypothetical protein
MNTNSMNNNIAKGLGIAGVLVVVILLAKFGLPSFLSKDNSQGASVITGADNATGSDSDNSSIPDPLAPASTKQYVAVGCYVGGASGELCTDSTGAMSTAQYQDYYACFKTARCEKQSDGMCGWTSTAQLIQCTKGDK